MPYKPPRCNIEKVGVGKVSTFRGFCCAHDTKLFSVIDTQNLQVNNEAQVLALHRRAVAYEIRNKQKMYNMLESACNISGRYDADRHVRLEDLKRLLSADIKYSWNPLWGNSPIDNLAYKWIIINKNIGVSMTSCIPPLSDLSFNSYMESCWDYASKSYLRSRPFFSLSIVPDELQTHIVMIWNRFDDSNVDVFRRLLCNQDDVGVFLDTCIFDKSEDFCLRPSLWAALTSDVQSAVKDKVSNITHDDVEHLTIFQQMLRTR